MKKFFVFVVLISQFESFSQEKSFHNYYWNNYEKTKAIVGATNCYVRANPSTKAAVLDSLQIGKEITVLQSTNVDYAIKGLNVSWVEVEYPNKSGTILKGYLWKGFIALGYTKKKSLTFLTTIDKFEIRKKDSLDVFSISVKILNDKNRVLDQKAFQQRLGESSYFQNSTIGDLGLKNITDIYRISFDGEACGIPSLFYYFAWNGTKIIQLPGKICSADGGIYFYNEDFIFPKEKGGKPDTLIKVFKEGEAIDEDAINPIFNVKEWKEIYEWNGEKAVLVSKIKSRKYKIRY